MSVREATLRDEQSWDAWLIANGGSFLQSWGWGEFQKTMEFRVWRFIDEGDAGIEGVAFVVERPLSMGRKWLYAPRVTSPGPRFGEDHPLLRSGEGTSPHVRRSRPGGADEVLDAIVKIAEREGAMFVRVDPAFAKASDGRPAWLGGGWRKSEREVQPKNTVVVDLAQGEEELLAAMHHKTRYNIRLAQKKNVAVRFSSDAKEVEHFLRLAQEVAGRGSFQFHPDEYYRQMVRVLGERGELELAIAEHDGDVLAVHVLTHFGGMVTYAHGASSSKKRELMAPHLLQWESMKRAKMAGATHYDLFGVAPRDAGKKHAWQGITRFKEGFGGVREDYMGAWDYVLDPFWYFAYNASHKAKGIWQ